MIIFKHSGNAYNANVKNLHEDESRAIPTKFDTGAGVTIFSVFSTNGKCKLEKDFVEKLRKHNIPIYKPKSATLQDMPCIARCKRNVEIGNVKFDYFYYYWFLNTRIPKGLIGDDFIRFCDIKKRIDGDIIIDDNSFDMDKYMEYHKSGIWKDALVTNEIVDEIVVKQDLEMR